jgi:hypothetical protein
MKINKNKTYATWSLVNFNKRLKKIGSGSGREQNHGFRRRNVFSVFVGMSAFNVQTSKFSRILFGRKKHCDPPTRCICEGIGKVWKTKPYLLTLPSWGQRGREVYKKRERKTRVKMTLFFLHICIVWL